MKKNLIYLFGFILLFSCQVDELDHSDEGLNAIYSKSKKQDKKDEKEFQYICHKQNIGNDWKFITLYLPIEAIQAHLDHGDTLGECSSNDDLSSATASCNCSGNVTRLDLRYNGAETALITVTGTRGNKKIYNEKLKPGDLFVLKGFDKNGTLGEEIHISVQGEKNAAIETNCNEPNILGYTYSDFTVEGGSSLNGGEFCSGIVM